MPALCSRLDVHSCCDPMFSSCMPASLSPVVACWVDNSHTAFWAVSLRNQTSYCSSDTVISVGPHNMQSAVYVYEVLDIWSFTQTLLFTATCCKVVKLPCWVTCSYIEVGDLCCQQWFKHLLQFPVWGCSCSSTAGSRMPTWKLPCQARLQLSCWRSNRRESVIAVQ